MPVPKFTPPPALPRPKPMPTPELQALKAAVVDKIRVSLRKLVMLCFQAA